MFGLDSPAAGKNNQTVQMKVSNMLYIIDFGFAKRYRDPNTKEHVKYREGCGFVGNCYWSGTNVHLGIHQARRDDMEAVGFILLNLLNGKLPWSDMAFYVRSDRQLRNNIGEAKLQGSRRIAEQCKNVDKSTQEVFVTYLEYCLELKFDEKPDYEHLRKLFRDLYFENGYKDDGVFDWTHLNLSMVCTLICDVIFVNIKLC